MIIVNKKVDDAGCISKMVFNSNGNADMNYTTTKSGRIYSKVINGLIITAWKDGCGYSVQSQEESAQWFDTYKWSMKEAMEFYAELMA